MFDCSPLALAPDVTLLRFLPDAGAPLRVARNSLVITGAEPVLVDTGAVVDRAAWWAQVTSVVEPEDVRWIFLSHEDGDHIGNALEALERCPNATLVTNWLLSQRLRAVAHVPLARCRWMDDGERFWAGDRELVALCPPIYDTPTTRGLHDVTSGVYWSVDCFGLPIPHQVDEAGQLDRDVFEDGLLAFALHSSPWVIDVEPPRWRAALGRLANLDPALVVNAHGPAIHRRDVGRAIDLLGELPHLPLPKTPGQAELEAMLADLAPGEEPFLW